MRNRYEHDYEQNEQRYGRGRGNPESGYRTEGSRGEYGRNRDERGFFERAGDEVSSWFGDEEADRRREMDERQQQSRSRYGDRRRDDSEYSRQGGSDGRYDRDDSTGRGREFGRDDDRGRSWRGESDRSRQYGSGYDRDRSYGGGYGSDRYYGSGREYDGGGMTRGGYDRSQSSSSRGGVPITYTYTELWLIPGPQTGRGPKGYQRSDDRIREDVSERLTQHGEVDASEIEVEVKDGEVTLTGSVSSRDQKHLAEDVADSVSGVKDIHNKLRVSRDEESQKTTDTSKERGRVNAQSKTQQGSKAQTETQKSTGTQQNVST